MRAVDMGGKRSFGILAMFFCATVFSSIPPLRCCARGSEPVVLAMVLMAVLVLVG